MSTRFVKSSKTNYGQPSLPTGYEKTTDASELTIPSCGLEDVDTAIFSLFDKEISPYCKGSNDSEVKKVPIVFAAGEKWAMLKRGRPLRDKNNTLILPLITIMRSEINQTMSEDVAGRGINQQVGEIVIRRKLDKSDRDYQSIINRLFLRNQKNVAVNKETSNLDQLTTERDIGDLSNSKDVINGSLLSPNYLNNVYETIVVPTPQFYTAKYSVTIWTQYTQHSNQILERIFSSFLPQGQAWRLDTNKGYWFVAKVEEGSFMTETNFEDMSMQERFIKNTFTVNVPAYFFANATVGGQIPIKRYVSSPLASFDIEIGDFQEKNDEYVLGSDDPTLPLDEQKNVRTDQRLTGWRQQKIYPIVPNGDAVDPTDPKNSNDPSVTTQSQRNIIKVLNKNSKGETTYTGASLGDLEIVVTR